MTILDIIAKKRDGKELTKEEVEFFINGYTKGEIADYQAAALIMAIFIRGMTDEEITNLTLSMASSGEVLNLKELNKVIVDKHSTGGVGDKVSLILLPLVASCGVTVAKMSGRGLGFTGGTVDKLESIPGYKTDLDVEEFINNVKNIGISMISQSLNLAPADKKIYALRDSISCVESIPLIASSIMSKKIASGADKIVIDVTVGKGAFMKDEKSAKMLADEMIKIGNLAGKETVCILTNMDEPLGYSVGNLLEVKEAVKALQGDITEDVKDVVLELGAYMLMFAGITKNVEEAKDILEMNLENGKGYKKFIELVKAQGGDVSYISDLENFETSKYIEPIYSEEEGYVYEIDAKKIGDLVCELGAGRIKKEDKIDKTVGIVFEKKVGDYVDKNEVLGYLHVNKSEQLETAKEKLKEILKIKKEKPEIKKTIIKVITN